MKWKGKHIGWGIFVSVDSVNLLNLSVVDTDDPQVEALHPQGSPRRLHLLAEPRPPQGHRPLQVPQHQAHRGRSYRALEKADKSESHPKFCRNPRAHTLNSSCLVEFVEKRHGMCLSLQGSHNTEGR